MSTGRMPAIGAIVCTTDNTILGNYCVSIGDSRVACAVRTMLSMGERAHSTRYGLPGAHKKW